MANEFFVRCNCRFRRFTGGKSRNLQAADGEKGIANAADELCGVALTVILYLLYKEHIGPSGFSPLFFLQSITFSNHRYNPTIRFANCQPSGQLGPKPTETKKSGDRQLREHIVHPVPELFVVPLEASNLLWVHAEGVSMDGHLIEIVGTPPL